MLLGLSVITVLVIIPVSLTLVISYISVLTGLDQDLRIGGERVSKRLATKLSDTYFVIGLAIICYNTDNMIINSLCVDVMLTPFMLMVYI
jgi:hypothetical protein